MKNKQIIFGILLFVGIISFAQNKKYTTYRVSDNETISSISRKLGITPFDLLKLNPDAKDGINIDEVLIVPTINFTTTTSTIVKKTNTVKKNSSKKDSIKDGILYHRVKPYETLYSLSRKYKVSKRKVRKLNKLNRRSKISIGQLLKFPTKKEDSKAVVVSVDYSNTVAGAKYITYTIKPQDTFYALTRKHKVSKEELITLNPKLKEGLKVGAQILIPTSVVADDIIETPAVKDDSTVSTTYRIHTVLAKEGFYRLKQLYGFTKEEILAINPQITDGLKVGMEVKIPNLLQPETLLEDGSLQGKSLSVIMMLPFKAKNTSDFTATTKESKFLNKVTDFYLGAITALDELESKGLSVNLKVLDTEKKSNKIKSLLGGEDLSNTDLLIGPLVYSSFKEAANFLEKKKIPLVSPISKTDHSKISSKYVIQNRTTDMQLDIKMLDYIKENYSNQKIIIIGDNMIDGSEKAKYTKKNIARLKKYIQKNDSIKNVLVFNMTDGFSIKRELFTDNIKNNKETWVILASDSKNTVSAVVDNLSAFSSKFKIKLFALKKPKSISKIENHKLNKLNFHYPAANYIDQNNEEVIAFSQRYKSKYGVAPTDFSFKGYDTTYDALVRLANNSSLKTFDQGESKRLQTKYIYSKLPMSGLRNDGVFIIEYENYQIKEVK